MSKASEVLDLLIKTANAMTEEEYVEFYDSCFNNEIKPRNADAFITKEILHDSMACYKDEQINTINKVTIIKETAEYSLFCDNTLSQAA